VFELRSNGVVAAKPEERRMTEVAHRTVEANGIPIHLAEAGSGPLVLSATVFPSPGVRGAIS
jgi:hypothetical protein